MPLLFGLTCSSFEQNNSQFLSSVFIIFPLIRTAPILRFSLQNQVNKLIMNTETVLACCFRFGLCFLLDCMGLFVLIGISILNSGFYPLIDLVLNPCDCSAVKCLRVYWRTAQLDAFGKVSIFHFAIDGSSAVSCSAQNFWQTNETMFWFRGGF